MLNKLECFPCINNFYICYFNLKTHFALLLILGKNKLTGFPCVNSISQSTFLYIIDALGKISWSVFPVVIISSLVNSISQNTFLFFYCCLQNKLTGFPCVNSISQNTFLFIIDALGKIS
jgi:hypothetical protein